MTGPKLTPGVFFPLLEAVKESGAEKKGGAEKPRLLGSACKGPCEDVLEAAQSREVLSLPSEDEAGTNLPWLACGRD